MTAGCFVTAQLWADQATLNIWQISSPGYTDLVRRVGHSHTMPVQVDVLYYSCSQGSRSLGLPALIDVGRALTWHVGIPETCLTPGSCLLIPQVRIRLSRHPFSFDLKLEFSLKIYATGGKHSSHRPTPALHLVLSGPAPCFYPAAVLSSRLTVKEQLHLYSPNITFSPLKATLRLMRLTPLNQAT